MEDFISEDGMGLRTHVLLDAEPTSSLMYLCDSSLNRGKNGEIVQFSLDDGRNVFKEEEKDSMVAVILLNLIMKKSANSSGNTPMLEKDGRGD